MKKPFAVGDRVRVYNNEIIEDGVVFELLAPNKIRIEFPLQDTKGYRTVWAKQCRRLVKKKRREFWIEFFIDCAPLVHQVPPSILDSRASLVHVREVKKV